MSLPNPSSVQWFRRSRRCLNPAVNLLNSLHSGFWMGVLRDETLARYESYPYHEHGPDDFPCDIDFGLEPWEQKLFAPHLVAGRTALVVGAGGGRELLALLRAGLDARGWEFDATLAAATDKALRGRGYPDRLLAAARFDAPEPPRAVDLIFIARKFLSHVHARPRRVALLELLRKFAGPNTALCAGFYIRDCNGFDWRLNSLLGQTLRWLTFNRGERIELGDHLDPDAPLLHHHYLECELAGELAAAGFSLAEYHTDWFGYARATVS